MEKVPEELKKKAIKDLKWGFIGIGISFAFTVIFIPIITLAYDPIIKYYSSIEKTIVVSGIYVSAWTVFRLLYFIIEESRKYSDRSIRQLLLLTFKTIKKVLILPLAIYPMTFLMLYMTDHIRDEAIQTMVLIGCVYLWNYIYFRTIAYLDTQITDMIHHEE